MIKLRDFLFQALALVVLVIAIVVGCLLILLVSQAIGGLI